jgi:hypothetical protein
MKLRSLCFALYVCTASAQAQDLSKQFPVKDAPAKRGAQRQKKKKLPPQAQSALKTPFPDVKLSTLKGAISATDLTAANRAVGKKVSVVGTVNKVFVPGGGSIVLLNFAKDYKSAVVGAIKAKDFRNFPVLAILTGKKVAISGKMISYKGHPEVELSEPGSIKIVK